jgi:hypothetical protein
MPPSSVPPSGPLQPESSEAQTPAMPRSTARIVITAEEALTVPDSALHPEKQQLVAPPKEPPVSVRAVASMVVGILGAPLIGILTGWFAIGLGALALRQINGPERLRGRGLALSGIALGAVDIIFWTILVVIYGRTLFSR